MSRSTLMGFMLFVAAAALFVALVVAPSGRPARRLIPPSKAAALPGGRTSRAVEKGGATLGKEAARTARGDRGGRARRRRGGRDRVDEFVVQVPPGWDLEEFVRLAGEKGCRVLARNQVLMAVRLAGSEEDLQRLRLALDTPLTVERNVLVFVPFFDEEPVSGLLSGRPFGDHALAGIGVGAVDEKWGSKVRVAVLDSGIVSHAALGHVAIESHDLVSETGEKNGPFAGHATAVASLLAGTGGGIQGVAPALDMLDIKVVDSFGVGDAFTLAAGIVLAVDEGADVINMSLGSETSSRVLEEAVAYALERGVVLVAAAGNDGGEVLYPAACEGVIAVGAIDATGAREAYSNGGEALDIMAPGAGIQAAWTEGKTVLMSGTSAAVPFVAGSVAVLLDQQSRLPPVAAVETLLQTADDAGAPGEDPAYGAGVLDLGRALRRDESGIRDAALASHYLPRAEVDHGQIEILVCAQNRGTETLDNLLITSEVGDRAVSRRFAGVLPGQTVSMPVTISTAWIDPERGLPLRSRVTIGGEDANPGNDVRTSFVRFQPEHPRE